MARLRDDLVGVVHVAGGVYAAGDVLPSGAVVAASLTASELEPVAVPAPRRKRAARAKGAVYVGDS